MHILYLGVDEGTSLDRANSLRRLGHDVHIVDPRAYLPRRGLLGRVIDKAVFEFGGGGFEPFVKSQLLAELTGRQFDVAWVDGGSLVGEKTIRALRDVVPRTLNYNVDDPFGSRDKNRFALYRRAAAHYDLLVVVRSENMSEAAAAGARHVMRVYRSADEVSHARLVLSATEIRLWSSEVLFVGTWMPERGPFMARLLELGVPLEIRGDRWRRAPEWPLLKRVWVGPSVVGKDYVMAIQCAKICLGLLSKGNRDLHTTRSAEIPHIGSVLCAERTSEHMEMYREDEEAAFWNSPEECAEKCFWLLKDSSARARMARAGQQRCIANGTLNEVMAARILTRLFDAAHA